MKDKKNVSYMFLYIVSPDYFGGLLWEQDVDGFV